MRWRLNRRLTCTFFKKTEKGSRDTIITPCTNTPHGNNINLVRHGTTHTTRCSSDETNIVSQITRPGEAGEAGAPVSATTLVGDGCSLEPDNVRRAEDGVDSSQQETATAAVIERRSQPRQREEEFSISAFPPEIPRRPLCERDSNTTSYNADNKTTSNSGGVATRDELLRERGSFSGRSLLDDSLGAGERISGGGSAAEAARSTSTCEEDHRFLPRGDEEQPLFHPIEDSDCSSRHGVSGSSVSVDCKQHGSTACESLIMPSPAKKAKSAHTVDLESADDVATTEEELQVVAELSDYFLGRGIIVDTSQATGAASICRALLVESISTRSKKNGSLCGYDAGPAELLELARVHLVSFSSSTEAVTCLLTWLTENSITASCLAFARLGSPRHTFVDYDNQHLRGTFEPFSFGCGVDDVRFAGENTEGTDGAERTALTSHQPEDTDSCAAGAARAIAGAAATALREACRAWAETMAIMPCVVVLMERDKRTSCKQDEEPHVPSVRYGSIRSGY